MDSSHYDLLVAAGAVGNLYCRLYLLGLHQTESEMPAVVTAVVTAVGVDMGKLAKRQVMDSARGETDTFSPCLSFAFISKGQFLNVMI